MNLLEKTKEICRENNIEPTRSKGQNFLVNEEIYDDIIESADLKSDDIVLEVGPGLGFLTRKLANIAKKVIAVELDDKLASLLKENLKKEGIDNIEVVNDNILDFDTDNDLKKKIKDIKYKVVSNLPYNITSVFLRKFLSGENKPTEMTLMLQKEVAERIVASPGKMSILAISVQFYVKAEKIFDVLARDFWPQPKVDSAIVSLKVRKNNIFAFSVIPAQAGIQSLVHQPLDSRLRGNDRLEKDFFRLVKIGFSAKRKMLKNNLANGYKMSQEEVENRIKKAGFYPKIRAQELSLDNWVKLFPYF